MQSLMQHLRAIAKRSTRRTNTPQLQLINSKLQKMAFARRMLRTPALRQAVIIGLLAAGQFLIASKAFAGTPLSLYKTFTGRVDYVGTGGTLRTSANDVNACAITTSSTQNLSGIPTTATIEAAYLYWAASGTTVDNQVTFAGQNITADRTFTESFISGTTTLNFFSGFEDVTSVVTSRRNASYAFSGLTIDTTTNYCSTQTVLGAWSLIVIYRDSATVSKFNSLNLYDGFQFSQNTSRNFILNNIAVASSPVAKFTSLSWEGDTTLAGTAEKLKFENNNLSDSLNPVDNPFNSTINSLNLSNTYGVDLDTFNVSAYTTAGATSVTGTIASGPDLFFQSAAIIGVSLQTADLSVTKTVNNAKPTVGNNVTFTVTVNNGGTDNAININVKDVLPTGLTYISHSGGTYAPSTGIWNVGTLNNAQSASLQITARVNSAGSITNTAEVNSSSLPDLDSTPNNNVTAEDDQASVTLTASNSPNIVLVKRVTAINSTPITTVMDDPGDPNDNNPNWPSGALQGAIASRVQPQQEVEYTIYFLSTGGTDAVNSSLCDLVPTNTTFVPDAFSSGRGIRRTLGSTLTDFTNANDADQGRFYTSAETAPTVCRVGSSVNGTVLTNVNGAVVVNVGTIPKAISSGNPANSYGFVRFRVKVN